MFMRVIQQCDSRTDRSDLYDVWENIFLEKIEYLLRFVLKDSRSKIDELKILKKFSLNIHLKLKSMTL